jgi:hypothetical protein
MESHLALLLPDGPPIWRKRIKQLFDAILPQSPLLSQGFQNQTTVCLTWKAFHATIQTTVCLILSDSQKRPFLKESLKQEKNRS